MSGNSIDEFLSIAWRNILGKFFSFVSRDQSLVEVAEKLCSSPSKCLTTLFVENQDVVVSKMRDPKYARYQVNIMMIPTGDYKNTVVVPVYCPSFANKLKIVNVWNPLKHTSLRTYRNRMWSPFSR